MPDTLVAPESAHVTRLQDLGEERLTQHLLAAVERRFRATKRRSGFDIRPATDARAYAISGCNRSVR